MRDASVFWFGVAVVITGFAADVASPATALAATVAVFVVGVLDRRLGGGNAVEDCGAVKGGANELVRGLGAEGLEHVGRDGSRLLLLLLVLLLALLLRVSLGLQGAIMPVRRSRQRRRRAGGNSKGGGGHSGRGVRPG